MAGQLDTFRIGAMKDLYLFLECGVFQESTESKIGQGTHGWACPHLAEVVYFQDLLFLSLGSPGTSQGFFFFFICETLADFRYKQQVLPEPQS